MPKTLIPTCALLIPTLLWAAPQVVINEIHYDPEPKTEHVEFIELLNAGDETADLSGWRFNNGVDYTFAEGVTLAPDAFLVITENKAHFDAKFGSLFATGKKAFDAWNGVLSNEGERVTLVDATGETMDEVDYQSDFPWPIGANGDGSMELIHPDLDNDLGGSWRVALEPTPNLPNTNRADQAPPQIRQVDHAPKMPAVGEAAVISVKVTDPDGVSAVRLLTQVVTPGNYIPAFFPHTTSVLRSRPNDPREANPAYEDPNNWTSIAMVDDGTQGDAVAGDAIYTATLPGQDQSRTVVRYRIEAEDGAGTSVRVPYADDPSMNFAYYVYDGIPAYEANTRTVHPDGTPYTHPQEVMTSLPVYTLVTRDEDLDQCVAYNSGDQVSRDNFDARSAFNWNGTFVYDGVVYDNIRYRLRQRNDRYGGGGKRSMRFRFNRGHYPRFTDVWGNPLPERSRTLNSSKMRARGGKNFGLHESMNNLLWNLIGVPAPETHWFHFRVVKERDEVPPGSIFGPNQNAQYEGDFFGLYLALEDYDTRFLDSHNLPDGNLYKLISTRTNGKDVQRVQGKYSVEDASDFSNILQMLRPARDAEWLQTYVNYDHYYRYHTVVEAVRHYDVQPNLAEHLKNRSFYFSPPTDDNPLGRVHTLPWDSDTSWGPNWNSGIDYAKQSLTANQDDREPMMIAYRNTLREFRDLVWQPDQIDTVLDRLHARIAAFSLADRDRWIGGTRNSGSESIPPVEDKVADMKRYAWEGGSWIGGEGNDPSKDGGVSGREGRDAYLDFAAKDNAPNRPTITYTGGDGFPVDALQFTSSAYKTSIFAGKPFASMEWRLAEVTDPSLPNYDPAAPFLWEWNATWQSGTLTEFQETIDIPATAVRTGRTYRARVRMTDDLGRHSNWSEPIEFTATAPTRLNTLSEHLRVTEIMYHPASASDEERAQGYQTSDFEYLELQNVGTETLDLRGVRFTKGIDFDFDGSAITSLAAGDVVLVVSHLDAFALRYGEGLPVAGAYGDNAEGRLSDGGERIKLAFGGGTPILDFDYNDNDAWPQGADGDGKSLILHDPTAMADWSDGALWVASAADSGTPGLPGGGEVPTQQPTHEDTDGDGQSNGAEALAGTDPNDPNSVFGILSVRRDADGATFTWSSVADKAYALEYTQDLVTWTEVLQMDATGDSTTARDTDAGRVNAAPGFYRVRVR